MNALGSSNANGLNVLIVDDDPIAIEMLNYFLEEAGYNVERAANG